MTTPVTVTGKVTDGSGVGISGAQIQIRLSWDAWLSDNSAEVVIAATIKLVSASDGTYSTPLWKNADLTPANSYYTVRQDDSHGNWDPAFTIVVTGAGTVASMVTSSPALPAQYVTGPTGPQGLPGAFNPTAVKTSAYNFVANDFVPVDTTSGAVILTLPTAPVDKTTVAAKMIKQGGTNTVTIACGGSDVINYVGGPTTYVLKLLLEAATLEYSFSLGVWYVQSNSLNVTVLDGRYDASGSAAAEAARAEAAEALLAPLASPTLTGTPTAPTKSALSNNTGVATTAYADLAVGVETARAEVAEVLLAPIASPTFTGRASGAFLDDGGAQLNAKNAVFGCMGDGVTDDSAGCLAVTNAGAAASGGTNGTSRGTPFFPAGVYIVTQDAVLTPTTASSIPGVHFEGAGMSASVLRFGTLSGVTWFYDNGATARMQFATFSNMGFQGMNPASFSVYSDIPTNANGFKVTSPSSDSGFQWTNCRFRYLNGMFDMEGTNGADSMKFFGCRFDHCLGTFYLLNNSQSFVHAFYGCNASLLYGDVFALGSIAGNNAGGNVQSTAATGA